MTAAALGSNVARLVIVAPSWVGDTVMATPVYRAMRAWLPEARLVLAARPGLGALLEGAPWFDSIIVADNRGIIGPLLAARAVAATRADAALLLPNSFRAALVTWLARVPQRIGYDRDRRGALLTTALPAERIDTPTPAVVYYLRLAAEILGCDPAALDDRLELFVTESQNAAAAALLGTVIGDLVVLNPGGVRGNKRWPAARFAAVADRLASDGCTIAVTGSPAETRLVAEVCAAASGDPINLTARGITLGALKGVLRRAALLITNDTGPRHIAVALGTPVVSLFGPTDHRWTTLRLARERVLIADPFLPEEMVADAHAYRCAIDRVPVADVVAAARALLDDRDG